MKYLYTCLFVLCGFALSIAQPNFAITPTSSTMVDPGENITFDLVVSNFDNIISTEFNIRWDPNVLTFVSIDDPNSISFPGLGNANFGTTENNISQGRFKVSWLEGSLAPISLQDGTRMFTFTLASVGGGTSTVEIDPTLPVEVSNGDFEIVETTSESTSIDVSGDPVEGATCMDGMQNGGETGVDCGGPDCPDCPSCNDGVQNGDETGVDCGGSCSPCDNGGGGGGDGTMSLSISSASVQPNGQICLDVSTNGFNDLASMQYSMAWNTDHLDFDMLQNITTELTDFSQSNIGLTEVDDGRLRVSWNPNDSSQGYSLADGTVLYQVCFLAVGSNGTTTNVDFTNNPLGIEVSDVNSNFLTPTITNGTITIEGDGVVSMECPDNATPFCMSNTTGATVNSVACVSVTSQNFDNILSFQHSFNFNTANLEFSEITVSGDLAGLGNSSFNADAAAGTIAVSWLDPDVTGITLGDDVELYQICFNVLAEGTHPISFTGTPLIFEITNGNGEIVDFTGTNGSITTGGGNDACAGVAEISINENSLTNIDCRGDDTGIIDINVSGGMGDYTFAWSDSNDTNTEDLSDVTAGTYTVTVSSAMCAEPQTMSFTITEPQDGINLDTNVTGEVMCFGETTGAIEATATGGTGTLAFDWSDDLTDGVGTQSGLAAGSYTVTITDDSGCAVSATVTVPGPTAALAADPMVQALGCGGQDDGAINLNLTGGTSPYTVIWDDSGDGENRTALAAGTYTPIATDANGCTLEIAALTIEAGGDALTITGDATSATAGMEGTIDISVAGGTGEYTYVWTGPDGFGGSMDEDLVGLTAIGDYLVQVTDGNGCVASESFTIAQQLQILLEANIQNNCGGTSNGSITILASGGVLPYDFSWSLNGSAIEGEDNLVELAAGTYVLELMDGAGNTTTESYTIEDLAGVEIVSANVIEETVSGINDNGSISIDATGNGTLNYLWDDSDSTDANRTDLTAGDYSVTITDGDGCMETQTFTVGYIPSTPLPGDYFTSDASCAGIADGSLSFTLTNGDPDYTIRLMDENGTIDETETLTEYNPSFSRDDLPSGRYDVSIMDANGLDTTVVVTIGAPEVFSGVGTVSATTDAVDCNGRIDLTLNGGSGSETYLWSTQDNSRSIAGLCPDQYSVTITDANGCQQIENFDLTLLSADAVTNPSLCPQGDETGNIDLNVSGGTAPFTYAWTDSEGNAIGDANTEDLMGVAAGIYTVVVTEVTNVSITQTFTVGSTSELGVTVENMLGANGFGVSCAGATDAFFIATGTGSGQYDYEWQDANNSAISSSNELSNVGAGIYELMVTDNQNCVITQTVEITQPTPLRVNSDVLDIPCNGDGNGEVMLSVEGGVPFADDTYDYTWSHDEANNFSVALGLLGGNYTVTITDDNACTVVDSVSVQEPDSLIVDVTINPFSVQTAGSVTTQISGGTGPYMYEWTNMETAQLVNTSEEIVDIASEMTLGLIVTDINNCTTQVTDIDIFNLTDCLSSSPVLTPNDDGFNELFVIQCLRLYDTNRLEIYSRWGQAVFEQLGYDNTWNGRDMNGNLLPSGAYYFVFEYTDQNGNIQQQKGAVTILND